MYDIVLKEDRIILNGITTGATRCEKKYIVYRSDSRNNNTIWINTYFYRSEGGLFHCCSHYGAALCENEEIFRGMTMDDIEAAAYNAWMSGAR